MYSIFWNVLRRHQLVFFKDALSRNVGIKLQIDAAKKMPEERIPRLHSGDSPKPR